MTLTVKEVFKQILIICITTVHTYIVTVSGLQIRHWPAKNIIQQNSITDSLM